MNDQMVNVKHALKLSGITQTEIANMLKISPVAVHWVVKGKKQTPRIQKAIAMAIGKKITELWPTKQEHT